MTGAVERFRAMGLRCEAVEEAREDTLRGVREGTLRAPVVLRDVAAGWPAVSRWDRAYLLQRCGDARVRPSMGLPAHGVPYLDPESLRRKEMSLRAFWSALEEAPGCYVDQQPLEALTGLRGDLPLEALLPGLSLDEVNVWIGRGTRSGLHVDSGDNVVVMIRGEKTCALAPFDDTARLAPFDDAITKSRVDLEAPDLAAHPRLAEVSWRAVTLRPGDGIYIPRGWWHYLRSPEEGYQISVNGWFRESPGRLYAALFRALGPRAAARVALDLVRYGALRRPYARMNYRPRPDGVIAWEILCDAIRRR